MSSLGSGRPVRPPQALLRERQLLTMGQAKPWTMSPERAAIFRVPLMRPRCSTDTSCAVSRLQDFASESAEAARQLRELADRAAPVVKKGVDTAAPVVVEGAKKAGELGYKGAETAAPYVQEGARYAQQVASAKKSIRD